MVLDVRWSVPAAMTEVPVSARVMVPAGVQELAMQTVPMPENRRSVWRSNRGARAATGQRVTEPQPGVG